MKKNILAILLLTIFVKFADSQQAITNIRIGTYNGKESVLIATGENPNFFSYAFEADGTSKADYWYAILLKYIGTATKIKFSTSTEVYCTIPYPGFFDPIKVYTLTEISIK